MRPHINSKYLRAAKFIAIRDNKDMTNRKQKYGGLDVNEDDFSWGRDDAEDPVDDDDYYCITTFDEGDCFNQKTTQFSISLVDAFS
mmetsp:Transcript_34323/g.73149  ORF Transcript_34323/g.73149 Transcript_34323/m.73149 type:complete len:86 (+) Transcript_34323:186-443(+)